MSAPGLFPSRPPVGDGGPRAALAWLSRACEPGHYGLWAYVNSLGPVEVAAQLMHGDGPERLQNAIGARAGKDQSLRDLAVAAGLGARFVIPGDPEWPAEAIERMVQAAGAGEQRCVPPLALWVRGRASLDEALARSIAVVGARASTHYGESVANQISGDLAERGVTVVSGGAIGIDRTAHAGALSAGGVTVAVLAGGIDRLYPQTNARMLESVADRGLLVTEWPPDTAPMGQRFLKRNRLIAGFTEATVVVEAALRSGARATASRAREMGKPVLVVPGPVTSAMSEGCLQMLREEAAIAVGSAAHVLDAAGMSGQDLAELERAPDRAGDELDSALRWLLDAVPVRRAASSDSIAVVAAIGASETMRGLSVLEVMGYVEQIDGRWRRCR